jgi:hypothetical protein
MQRYTYIEVEQEEEEDETYAKFEPLPQEEEFDDE